MFNIFSCFKRCGVDETRKIEYSDTIKFIPPIKSGIVIKVYDGDTITIASKLPYTKSKLYRFSVRLRGIDCAEMRTKNVNEKICAKIAQEFVCNMLMGKHVILVNVNTDKYGRILADVISDGKNVSNMLLMKRLAVKYDGGTKNIPDDWLSFHKRELEFI
jgi:endonuclease YncB( thermonuclease family)